jgi:outer membrane protein assembly factor BamB
MDSHFMIAARQSRHGLLARELTLWLVLYLPFMTTGADWPQFRGANHDGTSTDRLNRQWTGAVTNPVWRILLTNCLGSLSVSDGRVFTQTVQRTNGLEMDWCVALNATNGTELWRRELEESYYPHGGVGYDDGPRTTPAADGDSVFVLSSYLKLFRLNRTNGAVIWVRDLVNDYGSAVIPWQNAASPVIENGLIFLNANCGSSTLMALRTSDGSEAWRAQNEAMTHASPTLATIHGVRQVIFATQRGLMSLHPPTGNLLWQTNYPFNYATSIAVSPVVHDDIIFVSAVYTMASVAVRAGFSNGVWSVARIWSNHNGDSHWMTPVARDGFLYGQIGDGNADSRLKCIDMRSGAVKWSVTGFGRGSTVLVDDHLVSITESGDLVLIKPVTNAYTEVARFKAIPNYHDFTNKCWNSPAVSDGRVFVRSTAFVAAFDLSIPGLKMDAPRFVTPSALNLSIRTVNGAPVASNRLAGMEVRASTTPGLAVTQWNKLTNSLVLTGGVVRVENVSAVTQTQQFFIVSEPK